MVGNVSIMQENLQRLEDLNAVMERMANIDRIPVSEACKSYNQHIINCRLVDYMNAEKDPLLFVAHAGQSPFASKQKAKKSCICF
ncbi:hypothetical protein PSACC_00556 [Paramicrosporidium saccamoebae]|uniref:G protein gamma domain-containing protein n=1 Tax=Paramicrosporidium saccamoebae TaxID=1246581 RepID=A0A2H9TPG8_9FUNG|nr:hypothetical protein PSACC_00556 [Paramicrosporidium saccamoebae]